MRITCVKEYHINMYVQEGKLIKIHVYPQTKHKKFKNKHEIMKRNEDYLELIGVIRR